MKKLLEKKRANLFIIVSALIFLVVMGMVNVNVMSNKISKLNVEGKDDSKAYKVFTDEDKKTESPDVEFLAYFKGSTDTNGNAEMIDEISLNMGNSAKLYMTMNVMNEGYLKNGKISLNSKNMQFNTQINKNAFFAQAFSGVTSEIKLAQNVNSGNQHTFSGTVSKASEIYNLNDYNQVITVTFSGTFVDFDGNETSINKVVPLKIDLTGKVQSNMEYKQIEITPKVEDDSVKISFPVYSSEVLNELMLKENTVTAKIPTFNGYEPSEVVVNTSNIGSLYNSSDRTLTITKSSALKEDGSLVKALGRNNRYDIVISYPREAMINNESGVINLNINTTGKYVAYGCDSQEINSNTASGRINLFYDANKRNTERTEVVSRVEPREDVEKPTPTEVLTSQDFVVTIGKNNSYGRAIVSKANSLAAYNGNMATYNTYPVMWRVSTGNKYEISKITMKEPENNYFDVFKVFDKNDYAMAELVTNTGVSINLNKELNSNSCIYVFDDETNEELLKIDAEKYKNSKSYTFERDVKHIRVEAVNLDKNTTLTITSTKKINNEKLVEDIPFETFNNIFAIKTNLESRVKFASESKEEIIRYSSQAFFENEESKVNIKLSNPRITVDDNLVDEKITVSTDSSDYNQIGWKNGVFLVEVPEDVIYLEIQDINISNKEVEIIGYEAYKENGRYFIKILTKNENRKDFSIGIDTKILINPIALSTDAKFEVFAYNEDCYKYYYSTKDVFDINGNGNIEENVGYSYQLISIENSNGVHVVQSVSDYDEKNSVSIAPNTAEVNKYQETANINLQFLNNYGYKMSNVKLLGTIPFEGNSHIINKNSLNSEFNTTMLDTGIQVPEDLRRYITVYYSENENADKDLQNVENAWTTTPSDWAKVKRFLIDFGNYSVKNKSAYTFTYTVKLPSGVDYNKISYSAFAAYYSVNMDDGNVDEYTEPSKMGIRIVRKFKFDLTKFNYENNKVVAGAVYKLDEKIGDVNTSKIVTTDKNGNFICSDLYVDREYTLSEIQAAKGYCLNDDNVKFIVRENENDELVFELLSEDSFRAEPKFENNTLVAEVEDEPRFKLNLVVKDSLTDEAVNNACFNAGSSWGHTDSYGKTHLYYLDKNVEYILKETEHSEYYPINDINFKINYIEKGKYSVESENENFNNAEFSINQEEDVINVNVVLYNLKKPSIVVTKVDSKTNEAIPGVKFVDNFREYCVTNEEGVTTLKNLKEDEEIILKEIDADGYYLENVKFIITKNSEGKLIINSENEDFANATVIDENRRILGVTFKNTPITKYNLKIDKFEKNTSKKLGNTEFSLYDVDKDETTTIIADDEGNLIIPNLYAYVQGREYSGRYILMETKAPAGYSNNSEQIEFRVVENDDKSLSIEIENIDNLKTLKEYSIDGNTVKLVVEDNILFTLIKKDLDTGELLSNAKFIIYQLDEDGNVTDFAKDVNNNYVGVLNEDNNYVVSTDENGSITLPLKDGKYMAFEVGYPEGYLEKDVTEYFEIKSDSENVVNPEKPVEPEEPKDDEPTDVIEISSIEDLVNVQKNVSEGESYKDKVLKLTRTLDFNSEDSYIDAHSTEFGDINENGTIEELITELNTDSGFAMIGEKDKPFEGIFDGNNFEIKNIHIVRLSNYVGLFSYIKYGGIKNLTVDGNVNASNIIEDKQISINEPAVGGIIGYIEDGKIVSNCVNNVKIQGGYYAFGGIVGAVASCEEISNCVNKAIISSGTYMGGIVGFAKAYDDAVRGVINIKDCHNNADIMGTTYSGSCGGIYGGLSYGESTPDENMIINIENCYNDVDIIGCYAGGIAGRIGNNYSIVNCQNTGNITSGNGGGGIIGWIYTGLDGEISKCVNSGNITDSGSGEVGGIIGYTYTSGEVINIRETINRGNVSGKRNVGGIIGYSHVPMNIVNTDNYGNVNAEDNNSGTLGGFIGQFYAYNTNNVDKDLILKDCNNYVENINAIGFTGGFIGYIPGGNKLIDISNCNNYAKIINKSSRYNAYIGGFIGNVNNYNMGININNSNNYGDIESYGGDVAGFIGYCICNNLSVISTNNYGNLTGSKNGYLAGLAAYSMINKKINCLDVHNYGNIEDMEYGTAVGGLFAFITSSSEIVIDKCSNNGDFVVNGKNYVGGLIGQDSASDKLQIKESYNSGNISGLSCGFVAGLGAYLNDLQLASNIYNSGNITIQGSSTYNGGLFGGAYGSSKIQYAYNSGNIEVLNSNTSYVAGISGYANNTSLYKVYNSGNINVQDSTGNSSYFAGIVGSMTGNMEYVYNSGNINAYGISNNYSGLHLAGIVGNVWADDIGIYKNIYQAGNVQCPSYYGQLYIAGVFGQFGGKDTTVDLENIYLLGNVGCDTESSRFYQGNIVANYSNSEFTKTNVCYSKDCKLNMENTTDPIDRDKSIDGDIIDDISDIGFYALNSREFYDLLNDDGVWYRINGYNPRLNGLSANIKPSTRIEIKNKIKTFKITTAIMATNNIKGGAISGENESPYETVRYGENNNKEIIITPDEGYEISKVTVNGNTIAVDTDDSGIFTIPVGYFSNVKENINIIVTFDKKDSIITINKVDKEDNSVGVAGAEFKIEQIDERPEVSNEVGDLIANGPLYDKDMYGVLDSMTNNGTYYFTESNGTYISNNKNKDSTVSNSYMKIDLSNKTGTYYVKVNAQISSEKNYDYGYATITQTTTAPAYDSATGRFIFVSGTVVANDYISADLEGGKVYYLHFGYRKDGSGNNGSDTFTINNITLCSKNNESSEKISFNFEQSEDGKYVSSIELSKGQQCNSYIPIDLTNTIGKYTLKVNVESSIIYNTNAYSYGYVTITESEVAPSYSDYNGRLVFVNDSYSAQNYIKVLEAGKKYYLHFGYYKGSDEPDDTSRFIINDVSLSLNTSDFYEGGTFTTNENGQIKFTLPNEGTYLITEVKAPEGYILKSEPVRFVLNNESEKTITIENEKERSITVHHYLKDQEGNYTTVKVADDEVIKKTSDDTEYETFAKHDLKNLDLAKDDNGNYVVPDNASGIIGNENIEVNYYYEVQPIKLTVHHYLENSETKLAEDEEKEFEPVVEIEDDRVKSISVDQKYNVSTDEVYNELLQKYELSLIVHDDKIVDTSLLKVANQMLMAIDLNTGDVEDRANVISFTNNSELTYYYSSNDEYTYKVEYYYNNEIDKAKTETGVAKFDDVIDTYADKAGENYTLDRVENLPLLISEDENSNVVKVYYVLKETSKELNYSVEFYVENELQDEDTIEKKVAVDINEPDTIPVEEMELKGKYKGYKVSKIFKDSEEVSVIPTEVESGSVIKVYYTVDEENTKDLSYIVEYYKDDVLQREDTQIVVNTVQILHDNMIEVDKDSINLVDKYPVSKLSSIEKDLVEIDEIPDKVESGSVIRIFYVYDVTKEKRSYTVNYLEKDTNKVLHEAKVVENNRYEDRILSSNEVIDVYGYEYNSVDKDELIIGLNDEENVINVYYTKKDAKVVVSYYEEGTTNKIVDDVEITGKVNDAYKTTPITDIPNKYELVGTPENAEGIMTEDTIYVAYYYRIKDTKLTVKFINKATGEYMYRADGTQETAITSTGKVGSNYSTEPKDYEGFTLVGSTENTSGILTVEPIEVIYYYLQNTRARVQHIDKITGNILSEESKEGLVGDEFVTSSKDFEGYILVEEPKNKTIIMTETETILKYYYVHVSEGIIEKHVDVITGKILENKVITGNEGDEYEVLPKTFKDYDLVEDRLPTNSKGTMTVGAIEVTYYYVHKAEVVTKYINKATNEKMTENVVQEGHEGDLYTTENKVFDGYKLVEIPENATGTMKAGRIEVTYYYVVNSVTITENHYDINTMEKIAEERRYEGMVGDSYKTSPVEIEGYDLVKEKYPENAEGIIADKPISVDYYYVAKTSVEVEYIDMVTGKKLTDSIVIKGHEGDTYTTEEKGFVGYKLMKSSENTEGKMTKEVIKVTYYYVRPAKVIVNYIEQATGKELSEKVEMNGYDGEDYVTEAKEIKYYNLVKEPENKAGKYAINVVIDEDGKEIVDDTIIVNYYYEKKNFNLTIDKNINSIIVNGKEQVVNGKLGKVEVYRKELGTAKIQVVYTISVKNIGELAGKATIMENIPRGMKMLSKDNAGWKIENSEATYETGMIEPGKTQDIKVVFVWENAEANIGTIQNIAQVIGTESESGFAQSDEKDDADGADVIVAISTGDSSYVVTMGLILTVLSAGALVVAKKVKE